MNTLSPSHAAAIARRPLFSLAIQIAVDNILGRVSQRSNGAAIGQVERSVPCSKTAFAIPAHQAVDVMRGACLRTVIDDSW